ncbi:methyl-accepting chemotaxis protein [Rhizobium terrae]|uniref:methyl-accepting chemotaxis protein n=1 Tax=Rhizobium terrae TaxID=2171756 RepID=UPI000E3E38EE|nr:methyl-accepting chemotaxis protein [Rhizobium terrae]
MLRRHNSLTFRMAGLVLAQSATAAVLIFYMVGETTPVETLVIVSFLAALAAVAAFAVRRMLAPLIGIARTVSELAAGKPAEPGEHALRTDEIGIISRELERFCRSHLDRILKDEERREQRETQIAEAGARDVECARTEAEKLRMVVDALDGGLRRLAVGDLTVRLDMPFPEEFEGLRADFNHALTIIEEALGQIGAGARKVFAACADVEDGLTEATLAGASQTAAITGLASGIDALAETLRRRKMQTGHTAGIVHNAGLDMRHPKEVMRTVATAMEAIRAASVEIQPAARTIQEIAFEANMLAVNAGIGASEPGDESGRFKVVAEEIRDLAERAAEAAKEISGLSRKSAEATELGSKSVERAGREWDAMSVYLDALRDCLDAVAASSAKEIEAIAGIRATALAISRAGRDHAGRIEMLTAKMDGIVRETGTIDHQVARFAPVTILAPGCVSAPENRKRPKPGSHLRLVKS